MRSDRGTLEITGGCCAETRGNTGGNHRRKRKDLTKTRGSTETKYRHSNEGVRCRWSEAGRGQVRGKGTEKHWREGNHTEGGTEKQHVTHEDTVSK